jgi:predicted phage terminase large subunit-like protein
LELPNGVRIEAFGTGQHMRGYRYAEHRPTLIVCDDLQNDAHIESAGQREHSRLWFHGTLLKAGTPTTNVVNLATALHRDALAMELHRTPGWESHVFAAVVRWPDDTVLWDQWEAIYCDWERPNSLDAARAFYDEHRPAMDAGAVLLWPDAESLYTLMCMRVESGRASFEREKQGAPLNPELCEWPEDYFGDDLWFNEWPRDRQLTLKVMALDPSKGRDAQHGDYSAFVLIGIDGDGVIYVEADLARRPTPQIVVDGVEHYRRFRPHAFGMETNHFQELLGDEFARAFRAAGLADVAPWTLENYAPKAVRIRRLGPRLAQRRLKFRAASSGTRLLVNQLKDFPCGDHDDGPDALEMALRLATELSQSTHA